MICLDCNNTKIDFWIGDQMIVKNYQTKNETGKGLVKIFNPANKNYKVTCSGCGNTLRETRYKLLVKEKV